MKDGAHSLGSECGLLLDLQLQVLVVMVDGFRKILRSEPDEGFFGRCAAFAGLKNKTPVGHGGECRAAESLSIEHPVECTDAGCEIHAASVGTESPRNDLAPVEDRAGHVMGAIRLVSPSAPAVAVEVVCLGEIACVQQSPHLGQGVRYIRQRLGHGAPVVALVVE